MADEYNIQFLPDDVSVAVPRGTTVLAAATQAKLFVNSLCGGDGVCGRCRVIVRQGTTVGGSTEFFTREEIRKGYVLACEARGETDLVVEVPPETRHPGEPEHVEGDVPSLTDVSQLAARNRRLAPLVRKTHLTLPEPSLDDNLSDLQRLETALSKAMGGKGFQMGLKVTRRLPGILRKADWNVTAVTGHRGALTEIVDVEAGAVEQHHAAALEVRRGGALPAGAACLAQGLGQGPGTTHHQPARVR